MKSYKVHRPHGREGTHQIFFRVVSSKASGGRSQPVYYVDSARKLMDRLFRCRSKARITDIEVVLDSQSVVVLASSHDFRVAGVMHILVKRMDELEYIEELASHCWNKAVDIIDNGR
jgi:hypothetical protein